MNKSKKQQTNFHSGLTLVEMIVAISIISILLGLSIASYINFRQISKLQIAAQEVRSALVEASDLAFAPQHKDPVTEDIAKGYGVELNKETGTYHVFWTTETSYVDYSLDYNRHNIKIYQLPNRIQFSPPEGQILIFFRVPPEIPGGKEIYCDELNIGGCCPIGTIDLLLSGSTANRRRITVDCETGAIDIITP